MKDLTKLLEIRKALKKRKPKFLRVGAGQRKRVSKVWRRPSGLQNKIRIGRKSHRKCVASGWGSPKTVYGLNPFGLKEVLVATIADLNAIEPKTEGAVLLGTTGMKRRIEIIKEAEKRNIKILNVKDPKKFLTNAEEQLRQRRERRKSVMLPKKVETKEEKKKVTAKEEKALTEDEKKELERKEQEKILTRKTQ